jgi:hypothetical protein
MRRGLPLLVVAATAACGLLGLSEAAGDGPKREGPKNGSHCARRGSTTIYADRVLRAYEFGRDYETLTYACFRSNNLRRRLNVEYEDNSDNFSGFQVRRPWIGFRNRWYTKYFGWGTNVTAYNMRTRASVNGNRGELADVRGFGITRKGSLAWLEVPHPDYWTDSDPRVYLKLDGSENRVQLDSGEDIDPTSFATAGKRIYWMKGGVAQTATMP